MRSLKMFKSRPLITENILYIFISSGEATYSSAESHRNEKNLTS